MWEGPEGVDQIYIIMGLPNEPFNSKALEFVKFSSGITLLLDSYSMTNTISTPT